MSKLFLTGPAIAELAADGKWAEEFLSAENINENNQDWVHDFHASQRAAPAEAKWAAEYLETADDKTW